MDDGLNALWIKLFLFSKKLKRPLDKAVPLLKKTERRCGQQPS
jgi:hypothetical protein